MRFGVQILVRAEILLEICVPSVPPSQLGYDEYTDCQWEDETVRERTGSPPSCAEAKKKKSLALHTRGCLRASLRDCCFLHFVQADIVV